jgi:hypothetical protein
MWRRIIFTVLLAAGLTLVAGGAVAQTGSPLAGIPHMSDEPDGPEIRQFPAGIEKVYLVFDYETQDEVEIIAELRSDSQQGAVLFTSSDTYNGSGTANIEIEGPINDVFPDDRYTTIIRFRRPDGQLSPTAGWEWTVGDVELPPDDPTLGEAPMSPLQDNEAAGVQAAPGSDAQVAGGSVSGDASAADVAQATPQSGPSLPTFVIVVVGVVVVLLLGIIVWAVRGFMTTA